MFESLLFRELNSFSSFVPNVYFSYVCTHMKAILGYNSVTIILFLNLFSIEKELFLGYNRIFSENCTLKTLKTVLVYLLIRVYVQMTFTFGKLNDANSARHLRRTD